jgi:serine protease inhibitor
LRSDKFSDQPTTIEAVDFAHQPEAAREAVAKQTAGKITDLIESDLVDTLTRLILVNTVYPNARWEHQLPTQQTRKPLCDRGPWDVSATCLIRRG